MSDFDCDFTVCYHKQKRDVYARCYMIVGIVIKKPKSDRNGKVILLRCPIYKQSLP